MITALAFLVTLTILIVVHEYGHYRVAVACGVKVLRFSVGFGRVLWRHQKGETEFVLSALPFGGYVKMLDEREAAVAPEELHRSFNRQSLWKRSAIVAAGPAANLLLAVLLYAMAHWVGIEEPKALLGSPVVASIADRSGQQAGDLVLAISSEPNEWTDIRSLNDLRWHLTQAALHGDTIRLLVANANGQGRRELTFDLSGLPTNDIDAELMRRIGVGGAFREPVLGRVMVGGPAASAGLHEGDRVLAANDVPVSDAAKLFDAIRGSHGDGEPRTLHLDVLRNGERMAFDVTPNLVNDRGVVAARIEAYIGQPPEMVTVRYGAIEGLTQAVQRTWEVSALSLRMLGKMLIGQASLKNLSGPLTIADYAGQSAQMGLAYYLGFLALVSVSLGVLNLLPLPMLDGGHLMYHLFEGVTGRPVSDVWLDRLQRGGFAIMLLMMSLALYNDVARLLGVH
jgi:regulator of sigma E protease